MSATLSPVREQVDAVLAAMPPGENLTAAQVAKRANISVARAAHYLGHLVGIGLIEWQIDRSPRQTRQRQLYRRKAQ
jgi:hypothetical protein